MSLKDAQSKNFGEYLPEGFTGKLEGQERESVNTPHGK